MNDSGPQQSATPFHEPTDITASVEKASRTVLWIALQSLGIQIRMAKYEVS